MSDPIAPEFDVERLERQQQFLLDRAAAHDKEEGDRKLWHRACAAALKRDAALVAVLRGDADQAIELLQEAGNRFAALGIFAGFSLLEYSRSGEARRWRKQHHAIDARIIQAMISDEQRVDVENGDEPFLIASAASRRQLLHLYHALIAQREGEKDDLQLRRRVGERLLRFPQLPVGPTHPTGRVP